MRKTSHGSGNSYSDKDQYALDEAGIKPEIHYDRNSRTLYLRIRLVTDSSGSRGNESPDLAVGRIPVHTLISDGADDPTHGHDVHFNAFPAEESERKRSNSAAASSDRKTSKSSKYSTGSTVSIHSVGTKVTHPPIDDSRAAYFNDIGQILDDLRAFPEILAELIQQAKPDTIKELREIRKLRLEETKYSESASHSQQPTPVQSLSKCNRSKATTNIPFATKAPYNREGNAPLRGNNVSPNHSIKSSDSSTFDVHDYQSPPPPSNTNKIHPQDAYNNQIFPTSGGKAIDPPLPPPTKYPTARSDVEAVVSIGPIEEPNASKVMSKIRIKASQDSLSGHESVTEVTIPIDSSPTSAARIVIRISTNAEGELGTPSKPGSRRTSNQSPEGIVELLPPRPFSNDTPGRIVKCRPEDECVKCHCGPEECICEPHGFLSEVAEKSRSPVDGSAVGHGRRSVSELDDSLDDCLPDDSMVLAKERRHSPAEHPLMTTESILSIHDQRHPPDKKRLSSDGQHSPSERPTPTMESRYSQTDMGTDKKLTNPIDGTLRVQKRNTCVQTDDQTVASRDFGKNQNYKPPVAYYKPRSPPAQQDSCRSLVHQPLTPRYRNNSRYAYIQPSGCLPPVPKAQFNVGHSSACTSVTSRHSRRSPDNPFDGRGIGRLSARANSCSQNQNF